MASDNRSNILAHALGLFAARGYDAVGVQEIAEAAGVTKPTLYHYFGSKRGLLDTLLAERFEPLYSSVEPVSRYYGDLSRNLREIVAVYFRFAERHPVFYRLLLSMYVAPPDSDSFEASYALYAKQYALVETLFKQAVTHHGNMRGRHRYYAATLLGMINTYIVLALNQAVALDDDLLYRAVHQFMHGIYS